jgi:hypothetical protein
MKGSAYNPDPASASITFGKTNFLLELTRLVINFLHRTLQRCPGLFQIPVFCRGDYNRMIDYKIAEIKRECGID